jgi:Uma2 family endonuclease
MVFAAQPPRPARVWDDPRIIFPDEPTWNALSPAAQEAVLERIEATLDEYREAMSEGTRHVKRKMGAALDLDAHFRRAGRRVYIGSELAVLYPGESVIVPDVLAVLDCDPDYEPERWIVPHEKRGIDLVIEVRNLGKKHKDLVENVRDYARVRIPEYFSYDCRRGLLRGWRLTEPGAQTYLPIVPQRGTLHSNVLGLDLAVVDARLRFFQSESMVPTEAELVARLQRVVDERNDALTESERQRAESERQRAESERQRADVVDRLARVQTSLARTVLELCRLRGLALTEDQRARVLTETEAEALATWAERAATVDAAESLFA